MSRWSLRAVPVLFAVVAVSTGTVVGFSGDERPVTPSAVRVQAHDPATPTVDVDWAVPEPVEPTSFLVADATGPTVDLFAEPGELYEPRPQLDNPTHEGLPVVFLVKEEKGEWVKVQASSRPNELLVWVRRSDVKFRQVHSRILVEVEASRVTLFWDGEQVLQDTVAVGSERTPTPLGSFFVDGWVSLDGNGPYGAGQLSVAGFSEVLTSFGGGVGQIALHGTNQPGLLGQPVSNGCVRMDNDTVVKMAALAPLGTPVDVVA